MNIHRIYWSDRNGTYKEFFSSDVKLRSRRAEILRVRTKRPFDYIEIINIQKIDFPKTKPEIITWLNRHCS